MLGVPAGKGALGNPCSAAQIEIGFIHSTDAPDIGEELITPMLVREIFRPAESTGRLLGALSRDPEDCAHAWLRR
jgi:hypothetical protein